jgi:hypothetical protein
MGDRVEGVLRKISGHEWEAVADCVMRRYIICV